MDRRLIERWQMRLPVVQAPMAGGPTTAALVAAVCNAGGIGSIAAAYLTPEQIDREIADVRSLTDRPFAVNLFSPDADAPLSGDVAAMTAFVARYHEQLGLAPPALPDVPKIDFERQIEAILANRVAIVSFTFGLLPPRRMEQLKAQGTYVIGTATTVREAVALEQAGCDAIIAQGAEAGGHRGTFIDSVESSQIGTIALVPQVVDAVGVPVIASGGIMDGRGIVAATALGAAAVQMGTAFLMCDEAGTNSAYREALRTADGNQTLITDAYSGRGARGIRNEFVDAMRRGNIRPLSYPWQNALTRDMRRAAAAQGIAGLQSLWAGQGFRMAKAKPVADLMADLTIEIESARAEM